MKRAMKPGTLRTIDVANGVGVHPNVVREYEAWGLLPPIPRTPSGYRQFTEAHLDQMRLARSGMAFTWLGGEIKTTTYALVRQAANGDLGGALEGGYRLLVLIQGERAQAEAAAELLERWASGAPTDASTSPRRILQVAQLLGVSADVLRNWERNGLIQVPRDPHSGYRRYGSREIGRLRVIRTLRSARYSTLAILRMLKQIDAGQRTNLRQALDTPPADEDLIGATDRWLSTLERLEAEARDVVAQLQASIDRQTASAPRARLAGQACVTAQIAVALEEALDRALTVVEPTELRLIGTTAALLQGAYQPVDGMDLLARERATVAALHQALGTYPCPSPPAAIPDRGLFQCIHKVRGIPITIGAPLAACEVDGMETRGPGPWAHAVEVACGEQQVLAVALEVRLAAELAQERPARYVSPLVQHLRARGWDARLLHECMMAQGIAEERQCELLRRLS